MKFEILHIQSILLSVKVGFLEFRWIDLADICLATILLFQLYRLVKKSVTLNILLGFVSVFLLWVLVRALDMQLLETILGQFIGVGAIALLVVFQPEVRKFLLLLGQRRNWTRPGFWKQYFRGEFNEKADTDSVCIQEVVKACGKLASNKTGALIVFDHAHNLDFFIDTGTIIDAQVKSSLLESIFHKESPLHDGAVIIRNAKIAAVGCTLPVSENPALRENYGTRHKAAVGITEHSSCTALVVSEESGKISIARHGKLQHDVSLQDLNLLIQEN